MRGLVAIVLVVGVGVAQAAGDAARALRAGRVAAALTVSTNHVTEAADGSAVAVVDHERKVATIMDAATGVVSESTHLGEVASIALLPNGRGYWLGLCSGAVAHVPRIGEEQVVEVVAGSAIDGIFVRGGSIAWSSSVASRGGVLDARDGALRFAVDTPIGAHRLPRVFLSRDARHAGHFMTHPERGGRRSLILRDAVTGEQLAIVNTYFSHRERRHAFGLDSLFTAARVGQGWQLHRLDLVTMKNWVVDDQLRGGHFVDLFLSPSAHYLLEGDFEEAGAVLYDLADGGAYKYELGQRVVPVGFLGAGDYGEELAITSGESNREGLCAWSTKTAERIAELPVGAGKQVSQIGSLLGGRVMWMVWSEKSEAGALVHHLELVSFAQ